MTSVRLAVYGLISAKNHSTIRALQRIWCKRTQDYKALRFPPHVTLKGPFSVPQTALPGFAGLMNDLCRPLSSTLLTELAGPVFVDPDLIWLEGCADQGRNNLRSLHLHALDVFAAVSAIHDHVSAEHIGAGFRPHVTLAWGASKKMMQLATEVQVSVGVDRIALVSYPEEWPLSGRIRIIHQEPIA